MGLVSLSKYTSADHVNLDLHCSAFAKARIGLFLSGELNKDFSHAFKGVGICILESQ